MMMKKEPGITELNDFRKHNMLLILAESVSFGLLSLGAMWLVDLKFQIFASDVPASRKFMIFSICATTTVIASVLFRLVVSLALYQRGRLHHEQERQEKADHQALSTMSIKLNELLATIPSDVIPGLRGDSISLHDRDNLSILSALIEEFKERKQIEPVLTGNRNRLRAILESVPKLTGLFQAHLPETSGTTEAATIGIITSLAEVRMSIEQLITTMEETKKRVGMLHSDAQSKISETRFLLDGLNDYKQQLDSKIKIAIKTIIGQMNELCSFTDIIHDVTNLTNVVAINASIEATHAGKFGSGFAVVAAEVRKLSTRVESAAADIEKRVKLVSDTVSKELSAITNLVHGDSEARWVADIADAIPRLSSDFKYSVEEMDQFVMSSHRAAQLVHDSVVDVLGDAQFQDIIRQQIEQVQKGLGLLGDQLENAGKYLDEDRSQLLDLAALNNIFDVLERSYTMSGQRRIHQSLIGGTSAEQGAGLPRIELF